MNPAVLSGQTSFLITFLASFLIWVMYAGIVVLWLVDGRVKREEALHALFASLIAWTITQMIKSFFPTQRPFVEQGLIPMTLTVPNDPAFPSSHAATAAGLALSIYLHNNKRGILFLGAAFLVGWGRIASNVHYFADVFAGFAIGIFAAYMVDKMHLFKLVKR